MDIEDRGEEGAEKEEAEAEQTADEEEGAVRKEDKEKAGEEDREHRRSEKKGQKSLGKTGPIATWTNSQGRADFR